MTAATPTFDKTSAVATSADAEVLNLAFGNIQLLLDASHTGGALSAHRCLLRDGAVGANPHRHATASELFYVLSGKADVLAGNRLVRAVEGDLVVAPTDSAHAFGAAAGHDAELLVVITPGIERFEFFRDIARIHAGHLDPATFQASQVDYDIYPADEEVWSTR